MCPPFLTMNENFSSLLRTKIKEEIINQTQIELQELKIARCCKEKLSLSN